MPGTWGRGQKPHWTKRMLSSLSDVGDDFNLAEFILQFTIEQSNSYDEVSVAFLTITLQYYRWKFSLGERSNWIKKNKNENNEITQNKVAKLKCHDFYIHPI